MKRFLLIFFCIAGISLAVFYAVSVPRDRVAAAEDGVIDLRGAGLYDGVYTLGGSWEFYWGRLYEPEDFAARLPGGRTLISVPSSWSSHGYPRIGYATYRLMLLTPKNTKVMMYVPEILSAASVWVNGEKVFSAGQAGTGRDSFVSYAKSDTVVLPSAEASDNGGADAYETFEIVVQASNYEKIHGGVRHAFRVGLGSSENPLPRSLFGRWCVLAGTVGAFFIIGLYHLALFLFRRVESRGGGRIYLCFAANCFLIGVRLLIDRNGPAQYFLRSPAINARLSLIYLVASVLTAISMTIFSVLAFELKPRRLVTVACAVMLGLPLVFLAAVPPPLSRAAASLYVIPFFLITALAGKSLTPERIRARPYLGLYFVSLVFFLIWGPVVNATAGPYFFAGYILHNTFTVLAQFVMLSQEYLEARRKARELAAKEDFYHKMAHGLLTPLTVVSTNVQVARRWPDEAGELLTHSQAEIMKMARIINGALEEARSKDGPAGSDE